MCLFHLTPWNLEGEINNLSRPFTPKLSGDKLKRFNIAGGIQIDLYFATEKTWNTLLLIQTGPKENNIRLCKLAKQRGWHLHANGEGLFNQYGMRIGGDSEMDIYDALDLPYQEPWERK